MTKPPELLLFKGDWEEYENRIYQAFLDSFVRANIIFRGVPVKGQYRPATKGKGYSFWHVISETPHRDNRLEDDRVPDLRRCERIQWIGWVIDQAERGVEEVSWWENRRKGETRVVIWAEPWDYAVILAKRRGYYVLKTAFFGLKPHRRRSFEREKEKFRKAQKG